LLPRRGQGHNRQVEHASWRCRRLLATAPFRAEGEIHDWPVPVHRRRELRSGEEGQARHRSARNHFHHGYPLALPEASSGAWQFYRMRAWNRRIGSDAPKQNREWDSVLEPFRPFAGRGRDCPSRSTIPQASQSGVAGTSLMTTVSAISKRPATALISRSELARR
jgi:hypothetical protein